MHESVMKKCNVLRLGSRRKGPSEVMVKYFSKQLKYPVITRWNSFYDCFQQLLGYRSIILSSSLYDDLNTAKDQRLRDQDFVYLKMYVSLFEPIATAIDLFQSEGCNSYYGCVVPKLLTIKKQISRLLQTNVYISTRLLSVTGREVLNKFENRFGDCYQFRVSCHHISSTFQIEMD